MSMIQTHDNVTMWGASITSTLSASAPSGRRGSDNIRLGFHLAPFEFCRTNGIYFANITQRKVFLTSCLDQTRKPS